MRIANAHRFCGSTSFLILVVAKDAAAQVWICGGATCQQADTLVVRPGDGIMTLPNTVFTPTAGGF
jgi:hypothetical protein